MPPTAALAEAAVQPPAIETAEPSPPRDPIGAVEPTVARVLVLDHDDERRALLSDVVARAGGETSLATSGAEAIERLRARNPQALLVAGLPDGSPRGFIAWARPRHPDVAIVAIAPNREEATELYNAGADVVTTLPLDPDLLGAKLAAAMRSAQRPRLRLV